MPKNSNGYKIWCVGMFPVRLRNQFVGQCKSDGKTVAEMLEYMVTRHLRERERQDQLLHEKEEKGEINYRT
jgi:hypothetical protein